jgi:hypothetical protein
MVLAIWVEPWFALAGSVSLASFLVAVGWPRATLPLLTVDGLVLALVSQLAWFPRQDIARMRDHRNELRRRALRWLSPPKAGPPPSEPG